MYITNKITKPIITAVAVLSLLLLSTAVHADMNETEDRIVSTVVSEIEKIDSLSEKIAYVECVFEWYYPVYSYEEYNNDHATINNCYHNYLGDTYIAIGGTKGWYYTNDERYYREDVYVLDLVIAHESSAKYNRKEWGGWRSSVNKELRWKQTDCKWAFYTTVEPHCVSGVDRDHLVSIKEVHDSGGYAWSKENKKDFYNYTKNLYVMPSGENRSKSAKDFAEWQPEVNVCRYAEEYIEIKQRWNLTVDQMEYDALYETMVGCN